MLIVNTISNNKQKITMKKIVLLVFFGLSLMLVSCNKNPITPANPAPTPTPSSMDALNVPSTFKWKTTRTVNITFTSGTNSFIDVTSLKGVSYQKAFIKANVPYKMKLVVPAYVNLLKLNFFGKKVTLSITSDNMNYQITQ